MTEIADLLFPDLEPENRYRLARLCFVGENEELERRPGDFYPGVLETIPLLARKYPLYIVSNCQAGYIDLVVKHSGLAHCFRGGMCFAIPIELNPQIHLNHREWRSEPNETCRRNNLPRNQEQ